MNYIMMAWTNAVEGREKKFNAWYDNHHLREVVQYGSGMVGGRRYRLSEQQRPGQEPAPYEYMAIYDARWTSVEAYMSQRWTPDAPALVPFTGLVAGAPLSWIYEEIGPRTERPGFQADAVAGPRGERALFITLCNAVPGREAALDAWCDETHLPEMVTRVPGFVAGQRYRLAKPLREGQPTPPWEYLTIYEITSDEGVHEAMRQARTEASLTGPPPGTLDPQLLAWVYRPIGVYQPPVQPAAMPN